MSFAFYTSDLVTATLFLRNARIRLCLDISIFSASHFLCQASKVALSAKISRSPAGIIGEGTTTQDEEEASTEIDCASPINKWQMNKCD